MVKITIAHIAHSRTRTRTSSPRIQFYHRADSLLLVFVFLPLALSRHKSIKCFFCGMILNYAVHRPHTRRCRPL